MYSPSESDLDTVGGSDGGLVDGAVWAGESSCNTCEKESTEERGDVNHDEEL